MKFISLFSGIGGLDLGLERAGMECVAQVEIDDFCQKVLTKHWPNVPKFKDVRDVGKQNLPTADLICGGFPCQDVSLAGSRKGLKGKRSTLWSEFYRIICEIHPGWVIIENVPGLLSSDNGQFFSKILWELSKSGYDAEWGIVSAREFGAPHIRERIIILAYPSGIRSGNGNYFNSQYDTRKEKWAIGETYKEWNGLRFIPRVNLQILLSRISAGGVLRSYDGVPDGMDRVKALGNAVVPQVAEFIGRCILKSLER
jgi:DNA (cytosine-5)-methyltransferase 1